jgi:hypothetical protein
MISQGGFAATPGGPQGPNARKGGRLRVCGVTSDLGPVSDLSANGMRVTVKAKPRMCEQLRVQITAEELTVTVDARIVWVQRRGLRRHEIGLEFTDVSDEQQQKIRELVRTGMATVGFGRDAA